MSPIFNKILHMGLILLLQLNLSISAQDIKVPLEIQFALLPKVIMLEKNLSVQDEKIKIAILFDSTIRSSIKVKERIFSFVDNHSYKNDNSNFVYIPLDLANEVALSNLLIEHQLNAVYLTPLRSEHINQISLECKKLKLISFTGVEKYLDYGISILFDIKNKKPKITINMESVKEEGASFSSYLLRLANIINN